MREFQETDPFANEQLRGKLNDPESAIKFILAGSSTVTLKSAQTGNRFTFKVNKKKENDIWFVSLLRGPDNNTDYNYMGVITPEREFKHTSKSRVSEGSPSFKAFRWSLNQLRAGKMPETLEVWHEGRCGRCNRTLTVPESIENGFGPECINHI